MEGVEMIVLSRTLLPSGGSVEGLRFELEIKLTFLVRQDLFIIPLQLGQKVLQYFNLIGFCHNILKGQKCLHLKQGNVKLQFCIKHKSLPLSVS